MVRVRYPYPGTPYIVLVLADIQHNGTRISKEGHCFLLLLELASPPPPPKPLLKPLVTVSQVDALLISARKDVVATVIAMTGNSWVFFTYCYIKCWVHEE